MIHRAMFVVGVALLVLAAGLYLAEDRGSVAIDEPDRELVLPAGTTTTVTFHIQNSYRRAVRVIGLAGC